ncbi:hypothetical protein MCEORH2_00410 [Methylophilaceae bacterium]
MDDFNSAAQLAKLTQLGKTPSERLLSLFDALRDAPSSVRMATSIADNAALLAFCIKQANAMGASQPRMLAEHILLIAINANLQSEQQARLDCLKHGKKAALALILAQTQNRPGRLNWLWSKPAFYGLSVGCLLAVSIGFGLDIAKHPLNISEQNEVTLSAKDANLLYAKYEQMRQGTCQYPEALQIPDQDKAVYLENVVGGKLPTNLKDLAIANRYLEKVRCNFTPMLMANSTS